MTAHTAPPRSPNTVAEKGSPRHSPAVSELSSETIESAHATTDVARRCAGCDTLLHTRVRRSDAPLLCLECASDAAESDVDGVPVLSNVELSVSSQSHSSLTDSVVAPHLYDSDAPPSDRSLSPTYYNDVGDDDAPPSERSLTPTYYKDFGGDVFHDTEGWTNSVSAANAERNYHSDHSDGGAFLLNSTDLSTENDSPSPAHGLHRTFASPTSGVASEDENGSRSDNSSQFDAVSLTGSEEDVPTSHDLPSSPSPALRIASASPPSSPYIIDDGAISDEGTQSSRELPLLTPVAETPASPSVKPHVAQASPATPPLPLRVSDGDSHRVVRRSRSGGAASTTSATSTIPVVPMDDMDSQSSYKSKNDIDSRSACKSRRAKLRERLRSVCDHLLLVQTDTANQSAQAQLQAGRAMAAVSAGGGSETRARIRAEYAGLSATVDFLAKLVLERAIELERREDSFSETHPPKFIHRHGSR